MNTKQQGDVGLARAIAYFASAGHTVCIPLTDSQAYDLVVDIKGKLTRIQVKTTTYIRNGSYTVSLTTKGGNRSGQGRIKELDKSAVDAVFILTGTGEMYLCPVEILPKSSLTLTQDRDQYKLGECAELGEGSGL